jgi:hypothetical protein
MKTILTVVGGFGAVGAGLLIWAASMSDEQNNRWSTAVELWCSTTARPQLQQFLDRCNNVWLYLRLNIHMFRIIG